MVQWGVPVLSTTDRVRGHRQTWPYGSPPSAMALIVGEVRKMRLEIAVKSEQKKVRKTK